MFIVAIQNESPKIKSKRNLFLLKGILSLVPLFKYLKYPPPQKKFLGPYLLRGQTPHVGHFDDVLKELGEVRDVGVDGHLVLPLKLRPHLSELCVVAGGGHDVVHDVDVNVIQDHTVPVAARTTHVIHCQKTTSVLVFFIVYVD